MGEKTNIAWCDSTFNAWVGCTKVGPGCDSCYAEAWDKRFGGKHWGSRAPRRRTTAANWRQPLKWNREAARTGKPLRVFTNSLADVFDNEVPDEWRRDLFDLIRATPALTWMLLTKRIGNATKMLPGDWGPGYPNVWIMATMVNQKEVDRDTRKLLAVPAVVRGVSLEPLLGPVDLTAIPRTKAEGYMRPLDGRFRKLDLVIVGGESGPGARPMDLAWARLIVGQCKEAGVAAFFKQAGSHPILDGKTLALKDAKGGDLSELPPDLNVREFPGETA